jgi:hypothetical protein
LDGGMGADESELPFPDSVPRDEVFIGRTLELQVWAWPMRRAPRRTLPSMTPPPHYDPPKHFFRALAKH